MKAQTLKQKMTKKLAGLGVSIAPESSADRKIDTLAELGADFVNRSRKTIRTVRKEASAAAEQARAAIHEATKPKPRK